MGRRSTQGERLARLRRRHKEEKRKSFGRASTSLPGAFVPRRDDGRGQTANRSVAHDHAQLDWPAPSSSYPIKWRPIEFGADHGQKSEPAKEEREGLTTKGPLQKSGFLSKRPIACGLEEVGAFLWGEL